MENKTPFVIRLTPAIQMLMSILQKPPLTALGFFSQKMETYLATMDASRRRRPCHLKAFLKTDCAKQKKAG